MKFMHCKCFENSVLLIWQRDFITAFVYMCEFVSVWVYLEHQCPIIRKDAERFKDG